MSVDLMELIGQAMALRDGARGDHVGDEPDPVPHRDDFWISTDDVLDYARWIERQVRDLDDVRLNATRTGDAKQLSAAGLFSMDWIPWVTRWRTFRQQLEASWWDRVNAWDTCVTFHNELRALGAKARELGLAARDLEAPPKDAEALTSLVRDVREAALPTTLILGVAAVAAVVVLSRR